ncbi:small oligopeptide transporter, OPT family [Cordyceps fumosorosea ARSEF 2679]|uniref:Small oligopeptide transporter, OPT family n=1 Tax=Cordyceps fumosorosea (strain ARSEF 2679) TaxID=1081104 RepID=A0A168EK27_CORFA|nr:small oligopeptide transporter, OPT family [Cordyceps fumosorosea ARSEF 2679]OAA73908.1 small oligopeptide transporter, OPT family [Cordyceps fumosorosea ARSEF 2679]
MSDPRRDGASFAQAQAHTSGRDQDEGAAATERTPRHSFQHDDDGDDDLDKWSDFDADDPSLHPSGSEERGRLLDPEHAGAEAFELHDLDLDLDLGASPSPGGFKDPEAEDSPYPEVRAAVRNYDEDVPAGTLRAWTIGLGLTVVGAAMNALFSLRQPSISIGPLVAQVVAYPIGHAWARLVPAREFRTLGVRWSTNPGPFSIKEHAVVTVMASVSFSVAYSTDVVLAQLVFYKQNFGILFQLLLTISTQSLGYGIAGVMRKFLVYPASMIWPENLVSVTLLNAMYEQGSAPDPRVLGGSMPRLRWFTLVSAASFFYFFIPGHFARFLSVFAFPTWLAPDNAVVNQLFGGVSGLSLLPITFDWTQVAGFIGSPLIPPWHAIANTLLGVVLFFICLSSVLHYSGAWYSAYLPMSDAGTYDNRGQPYNTTRILTPQFTLDVQAYKEYSPLFISTTFAVAYGLSFASISALLVHTWIHSRKTIWRQYRNSTTEKPDIHMKLMRKYPEAPDWWYLTLFLVMLAIGLYTVVAYPTNFAWWAFLLAILISYAFSLPIGIIQAITNTQIGLNVLTEFIYGYIQPGRPLGLMLFKTFGYVTMSQALGFIADLKFGHYMKVPPRTMFLAQVVATTISCLVQIAVLNLALVSIDNVCDIRQRDRFTCPGGRVFFSASIIWGLIGPARIFSPGAVYSGLFLFFLLGAAAPLFVHLWVRRRPASAARHLVTPLIFGGAGSIPPATPLNYFSWGVVGFAFQFWVRRRHAAWWSRLNFLTSCGLDLGLALGTLVLFFAFTLPDVKPPQWWGNTIVERTMDFRGTAVQVVLPEGQTFGPQSW